MAMIVVNHDIEEAAYLSDRVVVMDALPGRIRRILSNPQRRPLDRMSDAFSTFNAFKQALFAELDVPAGAVSAA